MEDERKEMVKKFYEIYRPLQKRYNLRLHTHFSIREGEDDLIEVWEYEDEKRGKYIVRAKETEEIDCYKRAIDELKNYKQEREGKEHGRGAAMAV